MIGLISIHSSVHGFGSLVNTQERVKTFLYLHFFVDTSNFFLLPTMQVRKADN